MQETNLPGKAVTIIFFTLILLFAITASFYLYKNDFNNDTLSVIFPAVGAIILSFYLGFKSIYIDSPKPKLTRVNIVLLHDVENGLIHPMVKHFSREPIALTYKFRGLKKIGEYRIYNHFKDLPDWNKLKNGSTEESDKVIANILEFAFLDWLSQPYAAAGYIDRGTINMLQSASQSGSTAENLIPVQVDIKDGEWNPFIKAKNISINLPKNSKLHRKNHVGPFITFKIETPNSIIDFRITSMSGGQFTSSDDALSIKIRNFLGFPQHTPNIKMFGMSVEIETKQKAFSRHSDQAKLEAKWMENLPLIFEIDYSWDKLKEYYQSM